jgi:hypothetical protein
VGDWVIELPDFASDLHDPLGLCVGWSAAQLRERVGAQKVALVV